MDFTPGPLLDAQIARRLWRAIVFVDVSNNIAYMFDGKEKKPLPKFSTSIQDARKLTRTMRTLGFEECLRVNLLNGLVYACFISEDEPERSFSEATTKPLAICLAVLAALEESKAA